MPAPGDALVESRRDIACPREPLSSDFRIFFLAAKMRVPGWFGLRFIDTLVTLDHKYIGDNISTKCRTRDTLPAQFTYALPAWCCRGIPERTVKSWRQNLTRGEVALLQSEVSRTARQLGRYLMKHNFGEIGLFHRAFLRDSANPPVEEYLRSVGLSESEIKEVSVLFKVFCEAVEHAPEAGLPDLAFGPAPAPSTTPTSVN